MPTPDGRIPFLEPELPPLEDVEADLREIYASGVFSNGGPFDRRLAEGVCAYLEVAHCVPVASGTLGLMLAIRALARREREGRGGARPYVLLPSFTFPATALAVEWAGLEPMFCDIDPETWQPRLDRTRVEASAGRLAMILSCNTFGAPSDVSAWSELAASLDLPLAVDSASGLGGRYADGRRLGGAGVCEVFSMHATKTFGVGEGGLVTTPDPELARELERLRNFGLDESPVCEGPGLNAKLSEIHAAIACRALERHEEALAARRRVADAYRARLEPQGFAFQRLGELSPYQCVSVRLPEGVMRGPLRERLLSSGIETRTYFAPALHQQPRWKDCPRLHELEATEALCEGILSLPTSNRLSEADVERVCDALLRLV